MSKITKAIQIIYYGQFAEKAQIELQHKNNICWEINEIAIGEITINFCLKEVWAMAVAVQ